ncbi:MAG: alpha/beta fold hydrolase, partial [Thermoanaerobaculia bacterium]
IASDLVRRLVGSRGGYTFRELKPLSLKGVAEPLPACQVAWEQGAEEPAAPLPLPPLLAVGERTAFIGRERELEQLRRHWEGVRSGERRLVFLRGEPGIGKTRLAAEFALTTHAEGATVLFGRCDESAVIPYQPFVEALRHYVATCPIEELRAQLGATGAELTGLVPELARRLPDLPVLGAVEPVREAYRLYDAFATLSAEASRVGPVVLVLDDLHWADEPTVRLLKQIVRSQEEGPLLILGTYRETELPRVHPLAEALADLRRDHAFEWVSLTGLDKDNVGELIVAWAGRGAPPAFVRAVHELTEGNPFFIEEVLRHLAETGAIYERDGRWTTHLAVDRMGIPEGVKDVIGRRVSRLSVECNSILTIASVIGREFDLDGLERASDLPIDRLLELLEEAVAARVLAEVPHTVGRYSFSHALIRHTLYDELTTTRRVRLHGQTLQYADSRGVKLAYEVLGASGPYLITVGLGNCPALRSRIRAISRRGDRLTRYCRVILYDRRGVGFSAAPERGYSLVVSVEDLRAVLDAVGVERAVLWGATDGGPLAIAFAAQYPERVSGLILAGTTPKLSSSDDFAWGINPAVAESFLRVDPVDQGRAASELTRAREYGSEDADAIGEVMRRVPRPAWSKIVGATWSADARSLLAEVRAPALIIHDPDNQYIPVEAAHYLHEHIPGSQLEITEEYGPSAFGDTVYRKIGAFIEKVTTGSA